MKIRYGLFYFSFLLASSAYANGFYVGLGGGYDSTDFYKNLNIVENSSQIYDKQDNLNGQGYFGSVFLGYRFDIKHFFIATELDGNLSSLKYNGWYVDDAQNDTSTGTFTIKKSYGLSVLPGYNINQNVALYGRIGIERGDLFYSEYKNNQGNQTGLSEYQWLNALRLGAGIEVSLSQRTALRFEYDHLRYDTYKNTIFPMPPGQLRTITLSPQSNQFQLALLYKFS